jgi:hypothetical protein
MGNGARDRQRRSALEQPATSFVATGERILELVQRAGILYKTQDPAEQRRVLESVLSNCTFDRGSVCPTYKKPFDLFARAAETGEWRGRRDSNPRPRRDGHESARAQRKPTPEDRVSAVTPPRRSSSIVDACSGKSCKSLQAVAECQARRRIGLFGSAAAQPPSLTRVRRTPIVGPILRKND